MTRFTPKALLLVALAVPILAGAPAAQAEPPAKEEYVFEGPNAGTGEGAGTASGSVDDSDGGGAAVPVLIGVLVATAAAGAAIAIVRRQRT